MEPLRDGGGEETGLHPGHTLITPRLHQSAIGEEGDNQGGTWPEGVGILPIGHTEASSHGVGHEG